MPRNYYDDETAHREDNFFKSIKLIVFVIAAAIFIKWGISSGLFYKDNLNGPGYTMASPLGWERVPKDRIKMMEDENTTIVAYVTPEKDPLTEIPYAQIVVYTVGLPRSMWMEDEFPSILNSIKRSGLKLVDHGELKINEKIFKWILVDNAQDDILSLQFLHISESKKFYKIVYSSSAKYFNKYRPIIDQVKETFKLKFAL